MATRIGYADLVAFSAALLRAAGLAEGPAEATARLLVRGDLDGYPGHGIRRLVGYLGRAKRGVGIVCVRRAGHVGRLADYVEMEARRGGRSCPSGGTRAPRSI